MTGTVDVVPAPPARPHPPEPRRRPAAAPARPAAAPGTPGGQPGPGEPKLKVTLKVSDATPRANSRVRFYGSVTPARDGRKVKLQKRGRGGKFKTVAETTLRDAGDARSTFSKRLKVKADGVYRARFGSALSGKRKLNVSD